MGDRNFLKSALVIGDIILMYGALFLTLVLRYNDFSLGPGPLTRISFFHFSFLHLFWLFFLFILDFYNIPPIKRIFDFIYNLTVFLFLAITVGITYFYLQPQLEITPKTILLVDILILGLLLFGWRYLFQYLLRVQGFKEKIVIVGWRSELKELPHLVSQNNYEIITFFDPSPQNELKHLSGFAKLGVTSSISRLREIIEKERINSIIFATDPHKNGKLVREIFIGLPLELNYISFATFYEVITKKVPLEVIDEIWFLENISQSERKIYGILKRSFDISFSSPGLLITAILFPFIALAIKFDSPGSIFYSQKRVGRDRKHFTLYKFRSMKENPGQQKPWREKDSSQITKVGKLLRKTHLDEFPQFWSILKGDLSFVGPRPEWAKLAEKFEKEIPFYRQRYLIRPGFTGWAQLHYPASTSIQEAKEKFQYDLYYIKNRNFFLDLGIILKTIRIIFK